MEKSLSMNPLQLQSFFMGGFESCFALQADGKRFDFLKETCHESRIFEDYLRLKRLGVLVVRESFAWSLIDHKKHYDFQRFEQLMMAAKKVGIQQIWSLNHFDFPQYVNPYSEEFIESFATYALNAVKTLRKYFSGEIIINPINEIGFISYMGGYLGLWAPFKSGRKNADLLKIQCVRATIAAIKKIRLVDSQVRFIHIEPLLRRIPKPPLTPGKMAIFKDFLDVRFEVFDMIVGRKYPKLGGHSKYMDYVGLNYYIQNQEWISEDTVEKDTQVRMPLPLDHPRRISLSSLLSEVYSRYGCPIILTETGCHGSLRVSWWSHLFDEVVEVLESDLPLLGVCAYPVVDRRDWHAGHLTNSGIWDFKENDSSCRRIPHNELISLITHYIKVINKIITKEQKQLSEVFFDKRLLETELLT